MMRLPLVQGTLYFGCTLAAIQVASHAHAAAALCAAHPPHWLHCVVANSENSSLCCLQPSRVSVAAALKPSCRLTLPAAVSAKPGTALPAADERGRPDPRERGEPPPEVPPAASAQWRGRACGAASPGRLPHQSGRGGAELGGAVTPCGAERACDGASDGGAAAAGRSAAAGDVPRGSGCLHGCRQPPCRPQTLTLPAAADSGMTSRFCRAGAAARDHSSHLAGLADCPSCCWMRTVTAGKRGSQQHAGCTVLAGPGKLIRAPSTNSGFPLWPSTHI